GSPQESKRQMGALAIARLGATAKDAVPQLLNLLKSEHDSRTLSLVAYALGNIGPDAKAAAPELKRIFKSLDRSPRLSVATALAKLGQSFDESIQFLLSEVGNKKSELRYLAAYGLWFVEPHRSEAVAAIMEGLKDKDSFGMAAGNLQQFGADGKFAVPI